MKTAKTGLAIVLSYALAITPAFGQNEESSSDERDQASETVEPASSTTDQPSEPSEDAAAEQASEQKQPKKKRKTVVDEPGAPSRGTGKLVAGIVTASVGAGLGLVFLAVANIDCNTINKDDANSSDMNKRQERETDVKNCKDQQPQAKTLASVFLVGGLGVGLPLIYFGVKDRKAYNEWKSSQPGQEEGAYAPGKASLVFLPNGDSFSPGLNVTYNF